MKIFIDDGSTNIKLQWEEKGEVKRHISPNSFKREWGVAFGNDAAFNYTFNGENYSFDYITPDAVVTTNVAWQYSDINVVAVHHALLTSGLEPQDVDIVATLPLSEYYDRNNQRNETNIARKMKSLIRPVTLNGGKTFTIRNVSVMPESIPAGFDILKDMGDLDSLLIVDLGGTTLDIAQVMGKMKGISRIFGDSTLGVSLITEAVRDAMAVARTKGSSCLANELIIHRNEYEFLAQRINDAKQIGMVKGTMDETLSRLQGRVLQAIDKFAGYTHVMTIGGGAELVYESVKAHCNLREERFFKTSSSQYDLVNGMFLIGN